MAVPTVVIIWSQWAPVEQIARLMPAARFELIEGAEHVIWFSHQNELRVLLREFVEETMT